MRRSEHFKAIAILLLLPFAAVPQQNGMVREGDRFVRDFFGVAPAGRRLRIELLDPDGSRAGAAAELVRERAGVIAVHVTDDGLDVAVEERFADHRLLRDVIQAGFDVRAFVQVAGSLTDVFMRLTGAAEEEAS